MIEVNYYQVLNQYVNQLKIGAFLNVADGTRTNTMTIAWGQAGFMWNKPVLQIMVRDSRYTKQILDRTQVFTVSVPKSGTMDEALKVCGTMSGRDVDKFALCQLEVLPGKKIQVPMVGDCALHFECKVLAKQRMTKVEMLEKDVLEAYPFENFHTLYYAEVLGVYQTEQD